MIKEFEFYHGVVLSKIIHDAKNEVSIKTYDTSSNSSYVLNNSVGIYIKYSSKRLSPWRFILNQAHQDEINKMHSELREVFTLLVCGEDGIVLLSFDELKKILNEVHDKIEWISVSRSPRREYTVNGSDGILGRKVGKSSFPRNILRIIQ